MAEQNILTGDLAVLEQIISDIKQHKKNKEQLEKLNEIAKNLTKNIETSEKELKEEIDARVKESTASICEGYDKAVEGEKIKLKEIQAQRDKAKMAGVKERIANETRSLREENVSLNKEIKEAFKTERVPMYCSSRFYFAMFQTKGFRDTAIYLLMMLLIFLVVPSVGCFIPGFPAWGFVAYCFIMSMLVISVGKRIYYKTMVCHRDVISAARETKNKIKSNCKKIKKIEKRIRSDKNEEMYGLGDFDYKINEIHDSISKIEAEKTCALEEFENTAKPDIIAEIEGRSRGQIDKMKDELSKKQSECSSLDALVKEQRIYISSNYEAYLGKDFMNIEKLEELRAVMKSQAAETVGQAIAVYKNRR